MDCNANNDMIVCIYFLTDVHIHTFVTLIIRRLEILFIEIHLHLYSNTMDYHKVKLHEIKT